jgi:ATP-binding cassette subfamily F protein 3
LSGGEKARVALAKVIAAKGNFLMLDEPTNHLDMHSVQMLIDALNKYEGTLIFVSHDRYFIQQTANKIWEIVDGKIKEFIGSYDEWVVFQAERKLKEQAQKQAAPAKPVEKAVAPKAPVNEQDQQRYKKEHQQKTKELQRLEQDLEKLLAEKLSLESKMSDPNVYANQEAYKQLDADYQAITIKIGPMQTKQDQLVELLMELEEKIG